MYLLNEDTICAPATVPGTGAISVIRVSGPEALHAVSAIVSCRDGRDVASAPGYSVRYGHVFMLCACLCSGLRILIPVRILRKFHVMLPGILWTI